VSKLKSRGPWAWIPTLYYAEGLPFVVTMTVTTIMYTKLGISKTEMALYTSWLYLPWVIKPIWSPVVEIFGTRRSWILVTQLLIGASFAAVALTLPGDNFFRYSLAVLWLLAFSSATHDIAADGFYIENLSEKNQAFFVGIRSTFYRLASITSQGLLVMVAGLAEVYFDDVTMGWMIAFGLLSAGFLILLAYNSYALPPQARSAAARDSSIGDVFTEFLNTFTIFLSKKHIGRILVFLLLYRFSEAQLGKLAGPFLIDNKAIGGLGLSTTTVGFTYGTIGVAMLTVGGILGGILASRHGLKRWLWWMVIAINLPNAVYILLAYWQPDSLIWINIAVGTEQFGYGFGFTAYMLFMIIVARGEHSTAHFAICTAFMALGMMIPGMFSGYLQEWLGYQHFFVWILIATIPSFLAVALVSGNLLDGDARDSST
jgi:PAT family beta-lactamase induction signal transducer AmpG